MMQEADGLVCSVAGACSGGGVDHHRHRSTKGGLPLDTMERRAASMRTALQRSRLRCSWARVAQGLSGGSDFSSPQERGFWASFQVARAAWPWLSAAQMTMIVIRERVDRARTLPKRPLSATRVPSSAQVRRFRSPRRPKNTYNASASKGLQSRAIAFGHNMSSCRSKTPPDQPRSPPDPPIWVPKRPRSLREGP